MDDADRLSAREWHVHALGILRRLHGHSRHLLVKSLLSLHPGFSDLPSGRNVASDHQNQLHSERELGQVNQSGQLFPRRPGTGGRREEDRGLVQPVADGLQHERDVVAGLVHHGAAVPLHGLRVLVLVLVRLLGLPHVQH